MDYHSNQKVYVNMAAAGSILYLSMSIMCLRYFCSLGTVKDRCLYYEKSGDQYFGREITNVSVLSTDSTFSPEYFDTSLKYYME